LLLPTPRGSVGQIPELPELLRLYLIRQLRYSSYPRSDISIPPIEMPIE
jgi:hypothetical protein